MRKMTKLRKQTILLFIVFCVIGRVVLNWYMNLWKSPTYEILDNGYYDLPCRLPTLNPFDPSIQEFFWIPEPLKCHSDNYAIVFVDENNRVRYNGTVLKYLPDIQMSDINCSFRTIVRNEDDYNITFVDVHVSIGSNDTLPGEFTHIVCKTKTGKVLYDNILTGIKHKPRSDTESNLKDESKGDLSVYLFGVDSVSRGASFRYLPKTRDFLLQHGAYDFEGVIKVGDNTLPNLMPLLAGISLSQNEMPDYEHLSFNRYPFVWKNFSHNGYATLFAEDLPLMSGFNRETYRGFKKPPADHYMRPFWLGVGELDGIKGSELQYKVRYLEHKGLKFKRNSIMCNHENKNHMEIINYLKKFILHYRHGRKFSYTFLTELGHEYLNFLHYGDNDFLELFEWLKHQGFLQNSVLIFFSDHGHRFNSIRNTHVGRVEARMPMLYILLPDHIKTKYPTLHQNMIKNTKRLISHYDIHQTLLDLSKGNFQNPSTQLVNWKKRGISLFGEIPETRSCADAWIPASYCSCYKSTPVNITDNEVLVDISNNIVKHINDRLKSERYCKTLSLNKIISAQKLTIGLQYKTTSWVYKIFKPEGNRETYSVVIETIPGYATFDASCDVDSSGSLFIQPNIDRTNAYGNQTGCVQDSLLTQYCYC